MFCLRGPGIKRGEPIHGASLLDIAPTLLHLKGLAVGRDMDGKVLVNCFEQPQEVVYIDSWDAVAGEDGCHPEGTRIDAAESRQALQQLIDLGYIDEPDRDTATALEETRRELDYNLAQAYMDGGQLEDAARILAKLWDRWPHVSRFGTKLLGCRIAQGDARRARACMELLRARKAAAVAAGKAELEALQTAIQQAAAQHERMPQTGTARRRTRRH